MSVNACVRKRIVFRASSECVLKFDKHLHVPARAGGVRSESERDKGEGRDGGRDESEKGEEGKTRKDKGVGSRVTRGARKGWDGKGVKRTRNRQERCEFTPTRYRPC